MATKPTSKFDLQTAINAFHTHQTVSEAAKFLEMPRATLQNRIERAQAAGLTPNVTRVKVDPQREIKRLEKELEDAVAQGELAREIKRIIGDTAERSAKAETPKWVEAVRGKTSSPGVPTLFLSDFHWGEVVHPTQIGNVNQYNLKSAHQRLKNCVEGAISLLRILDPKMDYPGIVIPLGGDMVSGDIHEELAESNELATIPTVLDMEEQLSSAIAHCANTFGNVFLPCVTGNHGRNTKKIRAKDRHHTSFDWLLYQLLARRFKGDKRVTFYIPDASDAYYRVYNTRYALSHGDQFRGGDGMIGALGPIIRGDHKKRSRNSQIDMAYDVLLLGHWHQYMHLTRLIVNGSLKGYDEYAWTNNFGFEAPQQALWITHPKNGITFRMPVYVDKHREPAKTTWVGVPR